MRFLQYVPLLIAAVPLTLGQIFPVPDKDACTIGTHRCNDNSLQKCVDNGVWETTKTCSATAFCFAQKDYEDSGDCHPMNDNDGQCSIANTHRCTENHLLICAERGYLEIVKHCSKTAYCFAQDGVADGGDCHPLLESDKQQCSEFDAHRCSDNKGGSAIQTCGEEGRWKNMQQCSETERCQTGDLFKLGIGCTVDPDKVEEKCQGHLRRCNGQTIQDCSPAGIWSDGRICTSDEICMDNCQGKSCSPSCIDRSLADTRSTPRRPPRSAIAFRATIPKIEDPPCSPGDFVCDANFYGLWKCNDKHKWQINKKCQTPGACKVDGPGEAHCEGETMDPPAANLARGAFIDLPNFPRRAQCMPGNLACDKDRRFLFTCEEDGQWEKNPLQCFGPGYCRPEMDQPLMCGGFPQFGGQKPTCKSRCEAMDYLYCIGVSELG
ncbi:hypothetical protein DE146DRAFT_666624 [Phaeosphaeria sp. MPI-PUGE-AT-0046c]|nr:hypothetical protein DE146DRAFT_666624 [Phaeosphaeria sp. MPI-PUGE-AT-0046c]